MVETIDTGSADEDFAFFKNTEVPLPYPYFVHPEFTLTKQASEICRAPLVCFGKGKYLLCCAVHAAPEDWDAVIDYLLRQKERYYECSETNT